MTALLTAVAVIAYAVAGLTRTPGTLRPRNLTAAGLALVAHATALGLGNWVDGGLQLSLGAAWSVVAWQSALLLVAIGWREPLAPLAPVVFGFGALGAIFGVLPLGDARAVAINHPGVALHVLSSVLAYGMLTLAMVQALALGLQEYRVRQGADLDQLPPLRTMERLLFMLIAVGFVLLSLSLGSGLLATEDLFAQHLAHKTVFTLAAWVVFAALLLGRWWRGWRGRAAVAWTLGGYASLALAYFGAKWVLEMLLGQSWS